MDPQHWPVLWIRIRRICMFFVLPDPYPDPLVTSTDPAPDPSIIKQKKYSKKNLDFYCFVPVTSLLLFILEEWCKCIKCFETGSVCFWASEARIRGTGSASRSISNCHDSPTLVGYEILTYAGKSKAGPLKCTIPDPKNQCEITIYCTAIDRFFVQKGFCIVSGHLLYCRE